MGRQKIFDSEQVLAAIQEWLVHHGVPPTIEELRRALGVGSTRTVLRYLQQLEADGHIERWHGARGMKLLRSAGEGLRTRPVPLVGDVPAGPLMLAEENLEAWIRLPETLLVQQSAQFFLLRVRGDSMNRAEVAGGRIEDGDLVLVRKQSSYDAGRVVVALIDGEATVKRLVRGQDYFVLKPDSTNPGHQPIVVDRDAVIQGTVCRVLKKGSQLLGTAESKE
jgi:repressor LexA